MNNTDLPPLPTTGVISQEVCAAVGLYLAVSHDLTEEQKRRVSLHLSVCPRCVREYRLVKRSAQLVSSLEGSEPSARVDIAVMAAIAARSGNNRSVNTPAPLRPLTYNRNGGRNRRRRVPIGALVAAAAVLVVVLVGAMHFALLPGSTASAFQVPASSWNGVVIYHTQTVVASNGDRYQVATYHDINNGMMNVETTMGKSLDVMVVSDGNQTLGMDMKHNVAQWNANAWLTDDSMFNLKQLNAYLKSHPNAYLGISQFHGQKVYRILDDGQILLLNMQYKPMAVLQDAHGSDTGKAVYDKLQLLNKAPTGMFDMTPPQDFKMGKLPAKP